MRSQVGPASANAVQRPRPSQVARMIRQQRRGTHEGRDRMRRSDIDRPDIRKQSTALISKTISSHAGSPARCGFANRSKLPMAQSLAAPQRALRSARLEELPLRGLLLDPLCAPGESEACERSYRRPRDGLPEDPAKAVDLWGCPYMAAFASCARVSPVTRNARDAEHCSARGERPHMDVRAGARVLDRFAPWMMRRTPPGISAS